MLQFFFSHPGSFYGFGYDGIRVKKNERLIEHAIYTFFTDKSRSKKFPKYSGEKAAAFGADLFFKQYLSLFPNVKRKELKDKVDIDLVGHYSLSVNTLIFFIFNFIQLFEEVKEKKFDDLLLFLKNFLNCLVEGDFYKFTDSSDSFEKDLKFFSVKYANNKHILLLFDILFLFLNIFQQRLGVGNFDSIFLKNVHLTFSTFFDSCLAPEKIAHFNRIQQIVDLCYEVGFKLINARSVLMTGQGQDDYTFFKEINMDTYVYGAGLKLI